MRRWLNQYEPETTRYELRNHGHNSLRARIVPAEERTFVRKIILPFRFTPRLAVGNYQTRRGTHEPLGRRRSVLRPPASHPISIRRPIFDYCLPLIVSFAGREY